MQFTKTVLDNKLRLLTIPMESFESATVLVMVGAGSRYETSKNNGISHFLEHMAFKGTEKRPNAMAISSLIDGIGGEFNAFTGKETTGYYIKSHAKHIELSLDILSDMLLHSKLDEKELDKERGVIIEEINLYEDTPSRKIADVYERLLYGDTPLGWDIAGEKDIIRKIQREDFVSYMNSLYSAGNITVVIAGGVSSKKAEELTKKYFSAMKYFDTLRYNKAVENQTQPSLAIKHKQTEQVHLALGVRTVPINHMDKYPLSVLAAILGGGMSSRLFSEVREKRGLAYYVRTSSDHYQDCGSLVSLAGVDPKRALEALQVMLEQYRLIADKSHGITTEELKKAKEFLKGHFVLDLEDSRSVAVFYASQELMEEKVDTPEEVIAKTDQVTRQDVIRVAKTYLKNHYLNLAVIGNYPTTKSGKVSPNGTYEQARQEFEKLLRL